MANVFLPCNNGTTGGAVLDFTSQTLDFSGMKEGKTYRFAIKFYQSGTKTPYDITGDAFEMSIKDSGNTEVENLQVLAGFTILETNILVGIITPLTTGTAGRYTHELTWDIGTAGNPAILLTGKIVVKA